MDFVALVAELCIGWREGRKASPEELDAIRTAARRAGGPDLISAVEVLAEHGNELVGDKSELIPLTEDGCFIRLTDQELTEAVALARQSLGGGQRTLLGKALLQVLASRGNNLLGDKTP